MYPRSAHSKRSILGTEGKGVVALPHRLDERMIHLRPAEPHQGGETEPTGASAYFTCNRLDRGPQDRDGGPAPSHASSKRCRSKRRDFGFALDTRHTSRFRLLYTEKSYQPTLARPRAQQLLSAPSRGRHRVAALWLGRRERGSGLDLRAYSRARRMSSVKSAQRRDRYLPLGAAYGHRALRGRARCRGG